MVKQKTNKKVILYEIKKKVIHMKSQINTKYPLELSL